MSEGGMILGWADTFLRLEPGKCFLFRLFGYGLSFINHKHHPVLFSERYGYVKKIHVGQWCIGALRPNSNHP